MPLDTCTRVDTDCLTGKMSTSEDEFEQYRARAYSGGFSPSLRRRPTAGNRPRSALHRHCRRLDDPAGSDDADDDGLRQFTADRQAGQHCFKPSPVRQMVLSYFVSIGVGDGGLGGTSPPKIQEKKFRAIFM